MGQIQLWQSDGLGSDKETLKKVIDVYRIDGVQSEGSDQALRSYIKKLNNSKLQEMYQIDGETTLKILVDCFGAKQAFYKYAWIMTDIEKLKAHGWISPEDYAEVTEKYQKRVNALSDQIDTLDRKISIKNYECQEASLQIERLQNAIKLYKADLYDYYAEREGLPRYEK